MMTMSCFAEVVAFDRHMQLWTTQHVLEGLRRLVDPHSTEDDS
jgi:hypothetical protein